MTSAGPRPSRQSRSRPRSVLAAPSGGSAPAFPAGQVLTVASGPGRRLAGRHALPGLETPAPAVAAGAHADAVARRTGGTSPSVSPRRESAALAFDLRGHGASAPGPDGPGAAANMSPSVLDVKAAHAVLATRADVAPAGIGMCRRLGRRQPRPGRCCRRDPTIRGLVLLSAGCRLPRHPRRHRDSQVRPTSRPHRRQPRGSVRHAVGAGTRDDRRGRLRTAPAERRGPRRPSCSRARRPDLTARSWTGSSGR